MNDGGGAVVGIIALIVQLGIAIAVIGGMWKIFAKAGKPGWAAIVPIYNLIVLLEIAEKPIWWIVIVFIPFVGGLIFAILVWMAVAQKFGKSSGFGVLCAFVIGIPILGFGSAQYQG